MLNEAQIKVLLSQMTEDERLKVIQMCNNENNKIKMEDIYNKLSNNYKCPHCGSNKICKNGFLHGKYQQFKCNACKKNYSIRTNTIFFHTRKSIELWQEYIELFSQGLSLRKIVEKMDGKIKLQTAFFWRHKILKVLTQKDDNDKLGGIVEADETFFEESQKGSRNVKGRRARKRGFTSYVGDKKTKICVLTAIDRNKSSYVKPVGFGGLEKDDVILL
jgi:transposase-like protein